MRRREFLGVTGAVALGAGRNARATEETERVHIVSLSFDDGFGKSFLRVAEIYEQFGLSACFNIIASAHLPGNRVSDEYMRQEWFGDFGLWNELQDRGHEIMPHGYRHAHLPDLPVQEAKGLVLRSLDIFSRELRGFDSKKAVFNFPYNQSSPALEEWLPSVVMGFRTAGGVLNPLPRPDTCKIMTGGWGPDSAERHLDQMVAELLARPSGWLVYNLHGLDEEGWGPVSEGYLDALLQRLRMTASVRIVPTARVLLQAKGRNSIQE